MSMNEEEIKLIKGLQYKIQELENRIEKLESIMLSNKKSRSKKGA